VHVAAATVRGVADPGWAELELPHPHLLPLPMPSARCPPAMPAFANPAADGAIGLAVALESRRRFFALLALPDPPGTRSSGRRSALYPPSHALFDVDNADTPVSFATLMKYF